MDQNWRKDARKKGRERIKAIYSTLLKHRCLNREQVQVLCFKGLSVASATRQAQSKLKKLTDRGKVKRFQPDKCEPCVYFVEKKPRNYEASLLVNWVLIEIIKQQEVFWWRTIEDFELEKYIAIPNRTKGKKKDHFQPDLFVWLKWTIEEKEKNKPAQIIPIFIEVERTRRTFVKMPQYTDYYNSWGWFRDKLSWKKNNMDRFPLILVITENEPHKRSIESKIAKDKENPKKLPVVVATMEEVRQDVFALVDRGYKLCGD